MTKQSGTDGVAIKMIIPRKMMQNGSNDTIRSKEKRNLQVLNPKDIGSDKSRFSEFQRESVKFELNAMVM